jgi:hypothetical protein
MIGPAPEGREKIEAGAFVDFNSPPSLRADFRAPMRAGRRQGVLASGAARASSPGEADYSLCFVLFVSQLIKSNRQTYTKAQMTNNAPRIIVNGTIENDSSNPQLRGQIEYQALVLRKRKVIFIATPPLLNNWSEMKIDALEHFFDKLVNDMKSQLEGNHHEKSFVPGDWELYIYFHFRRDAEVNQSQEGKSLVNQA